MASNSMGSPALEIQTLARAVVYARDRILQGDWTPKYGNQQVERQAKECEQMLVFFGCKDVDVYAHVSPSGRGLMKWSYRDTDGEVHTGSVHPTGF